MENMMGNAHEGEQGMMQHCMEMMNSIMGGSTMDATSTASMGFNLPLSLVVALILAGTLGYLLGVVSRHRAQS
jgi:hypothetical protein